MVSEAFIVCLAPFVPLVVMASAVLVVSPVLIVVDLRERRLPNRAVALAAAGLPLGWLTALVRDDLGGALTSMATLGAAGLLLGGAAWVGLVGMGDAKLASVLAASLATVSSSAVVAAAVLATAAGGLVATGTLVVEAVRARRSHGKARDGRGEKPSIAFGPCLLAGYWITVAGVLSRGASC
ncbi:hypothetical protein ACPEEZ_04015 [Frigoribacterium sp. 2-23]|uniref:hypothetical protein n=1 Tax=Frigoribacterium sp. 2-23 TaxID=3415006 RepID=UPI003C6FAED2